MIEKVKQVVVATLQLGTQAQSWGAQTRLLGAIPELDSMAVVSLIAGLEEQFGITVHDDEIEASTFETLGTLTEFVEKKLAS